jgi:acyl carrier protein
MEDVPAGATVMGVPGEIILTMDQKTRMNGAGRLLASRLSPIGGVPQHAGGPTEPGVKPRPVLDQTFVAPRDGVEERVARIWADVLHLDHVGVQDNFFHLGGASLATIEITTRLLREFAVNIPIEALLHTPTVAELSRTIEAKMMESAKGPTPDQLRRLDVLSDAEVQALLTDLG